MQTTAVVIAHNEEDRISQCLTSLLKQTKRLNEIIVVCHNCTDRTEEIASQFPVTVVPLHGPPGPHHARIKGFEVARGDIILCIDGDSIAQENWAETLASLLRKQGVVLAGSWVRMVGTLYIRLGSLCWYLFANENASQPTDWLFGASYGIRSEDKDRAILALKNGIELSKELSLPFNPDDFWLALLLQKNGDVVVTNRTSVCAEAKEATSWDSFVRGAKARRVRRTILTHLEKERIAQAPL